MTTPAGTAGQTPDTTVGGGGDFTPGADDPNYRAPGSNQVNEPLTGERATDDSSGGTQAGRSGNTDSHLSDPRSNIGDTTVAGGGAGGLGRTGDTDSHTRDPRPVADTTQLGGGVGSSSTGQAYRAPSGDVPAGNVDTTGRGGFMAVNPASPDAALVGNASGINPNSLEPAFHTGANDVSGTRDTTNAGSPSISPIPATGGMPQAPTSVTAVPVNQRAAVTVSWTAPSNATAAGVVGYIVMSNTNGTTEVGKNSTSVEFEQGLIPGDTYTFTVLARNSNGTGRRSAPSAPLTLPFDFNEVADVTRDEGL